MFQVFLYLKGTLYAKDYKQDAHVYNNGFYRTAEVLKIKVKRIFKTSCFNFNTSNQELKMPIYLKIMW